MVRAADAAAGDQMAADPLAFVSIEVAGGATPTYTPVLDRRGGGAVALRFHSKDAVDVVKISGMPDQISDYAVDYVNEKGAVVRTFALADPRDAFDVNLSERPTPPPSFPLSV